MKHKEREEKSTSVSYRMTAGSLILGWPKVCSDFSVRSFRNTQWTFWPTQYMCSYSPQGRGRVRQNVNTQWLKNFPNLTKTIIPWSQEVKKKKNPKHKKQRKQSNCLNSVKKKILKATRGEKTLRTKNQKLTTDLTKMMQVKRERRNVIKVTKLSLQNSIPSKNIIQKWRGNEFLRHGKAGRFCHQQSCITGNIGDSRWGL